jgi:hypothetical protein
LDDKQEPIPESPMDHPDEQPAGTDAPFKFGRLLLVLAGAVAVIALVAVLAGTYFA